MGFKCGIVGLPNVGKSTLFNALTESAAAQAANYPFCTIEPNVGDVPVPDPRLETLADIAKSAQVLPTRLTFVDIAGLVRGASKGEGLGNKFLAHIREVDAIASGSIELADTNDIDLGLVSRYIRAFSGISEPQGSVVGRSSFTMTINSGSSAYL